MTILRPSSLRRSSCFFFMPARLLLSSSLSATSLSYSSLFASMAAVSSSILSISESRLPISFLSLIRLRFMISSMRFSISSDILGISSPPGTVRKRFLKSPLVSILLLATCSRSIANIDLYVSASMLSSSEGNGFPLASVTFLPFLTSILSSPSSITIISVPESFLSAEGYLDFLPGKRVLRMNSMVVVFPVSFAPVKSVTFSLRSPEVHPFTFPKEFMLILRILILHPPSISRRSSGLRR